MCSNTNEYCMLCCCCVDVLMLYNISRTAELTPGPGLVSCDWLETLA